ncbi:hypothetical protein EEZ25_21975 [Micromonospora aurantiaca]|nr:hypothetical protein EEZ25_21975 [Micromonospora aurantiaca]
MTGDVVDIVALSRLWDERWPGCSKLPYELRGQHGAVVVVVAFAVVQRCSSTQRRLPRSSTRRRGRASGSGTATGEGCVSTRTHRSFRSAMGRCTR